MSAICGTLGGTGEALAALLNALPSVAGDHATHTAGPARLGCRGKTALALDQDAALACAADARLDDRSAVMDALGVPPPQRAGLTDAELILRAFARWREACPQHLLGDYAFAVWDRPRRELFCARDHVGGRPLYYATETRAGGGGEAVFLFASTAKALLAAPEVSSCLDESVVAARLASPRPDTRTRTCYRAVRKVPAGHGLLVKPAAAQPLGNGAGANDASVGRTRRRLVRHWRPEEVPVAKPAPDDDYAGQFLGLLEQAVGDRLAGGPVGVHLSGGLDSSSIAVHAARALRRRGLAPPPAFSWLPPPGSTAPGPANQQEEYALVEAVGKQEGLDVFHAAPSAEDVASVLRRDGALSSDVPFAEPVTLRRAAGIGVRVLLSGAGGDDCVSFNGRGHWERLLLRGRWRALAGEWRAEQRAAWRLLAHTVIPLAHPALPMAIGRWRSGRAMRRRWFIAPGFARRVTPRVVPMTRTISVRRTQLAFLQDGRLDFQEHWQALGSEYGIEYRFPLLDRRLVEFALSLPPNQFRHPGGDRWLMRHAHRNVLPRAVCWNRRKADPIRAGALVRAIATALPTVADQLEDASPSRAGYVDVPALLAHLRTDPLAAARHFAPARAALSFLDF